MSFFLCVCDTVNGPKLELEIHYKVDYFNETLDEKVRFFLCICVTLNGPKPELEVHDEVDYSTGTFDEKVSFLCGIETKRKQVHSDPNTKYP